MGLFKKKEEPSSKVGRVRKCPQCGAAVPASKVICPECGWEFDDTNNRESALERLNNELQKANGFFSSRTPEEVLSSFRIPKSKGDLLEVTMFFKAKLSSDSEYQNEYRTKYEECIMKCKQYYAQDPDFARLISEYDNMVRHRANSAFIKRILTIVGVILGVCLLAFGIWKISSVVSANKKAKPKNITIEQSIALNDEDAIIRAIDNTKKIEDPLSVITTLVKSNHLDAAIYLYENKTNHTDTYQMDHPSWDVAEFTRSATKVLYDALIKAERMEEAWNYHALDYDTPTYAGNCNCYFQYVMDVVNYYCKQNRKQEARVFLKEHLIWFVNYVDNGEWGKNYPNFTSAKVNQRISKYINEY